MNWIELNFVIRNARYIEKGINDEIKKTIKRKDTQLDAFILLVLRRLFDSHLPVEKGIPVFNRKILSCSLRRRRQVRK